MAPVGASALEISITTNFANLSAAQADFDATRSKFGNFFVTEDFEGSTVGEIGNASAVLNTGTVGSFTTAGGTGSGSSVQGSRVNLAVRNENIGNTGGRFNTSDGAGDKKQLDSNDTLGMNWVVSDQASNRLFDRILFTLTDPADQNKTLTIKAKDKD